MFKRLLKNKKDIKKEEAKQLILKELFNSSKHKKAIEKAAIESAKDQQIMLKKYNALVGQ